MKCFVHGMKEKMSKCESEQRHAANNMMLNQDSASSPNKKSKYVNGSDIAHFPFKIIIRSLQYQDMQASKQTT